ncbi:MAG: hypothetical protein M3380_06800, partial [Chloroflexota bacterium]|nr:hypothetical protein [Chloroflexota bacterium]
MSMPILDVHALGRVLAVRDLTDPAQGPHALQLLLDEIEQAAANRWRVPVRRRRAHPVVSVADNYDRLGYPPDGAARAARYTRYLDADTVLRTMTTVMIPPLLEELAVAPVPDVVLSCPGLVYRRDAIDRHHEGEPHQLDLWRIRTVGRLLGRDDLTQMVSMILSATVPGQRWRVIGTRHPYTTNGLQIDVKHADGWVEVGECGLAHPDLLSQSGLDPVVTSGLAMGLGLDRLLMLRKGLDDIRLLRSTDPRVAAQMLDLQPYRPV